MSNKRLNQFQIDVEAGSNPVTLVELVMDSTVGQQSALQVSGGKVKVDVSEVPVIIAVGIKPQPPSGPAPPITPPVSKLCTGLASPGLLCHPETSSSAYV